MPEKIKQPEKKYFTVKMETLVPCVITYRIYAKTEEDAIAMTKKATPTSVRPNISLKRVLKATVYDAGSSIVKLVKSFSR
jgi:hypothetical protein